MECTDFCFSIQEPSSNAVKLVYPFPRESNPSYGEKDRGEIRRIFRCVGMIGVDGRRLSSAFFVLRIVLCFYHGLL